MRLIDELSVHCSATRPDWMQHERSSTKVKEFRRWHLARGWSDIGYHFVIDRDGTITAGRPLTRVPAAVLGHNTGMIAVCLVGGHGAASTDSFSDHFTVEQDNALRGLIAKQRLAFPTITKISGHNEYANKGCPGFDVMTWFRSGSTAKPKPASPFLSWLITFLGGRVNV